MNELIENGEQQTLSDNERVQLIDAGMVYFCENCHCLHMSSGYTLLDIDIEIGNL